MAAAVSMTPTRSFESHVDKVTLSSSAMVYALSRTYVHDYNITELY